MVMVVVMVMGVVQCAEQTEEKVVYLLGKCKYMIAAYLYSDKFKCNDGGAAAAPH